LLAIDPALVPVAGLNADEDANNDDQEIDRDREPIMVSDVLAYSTEDDRFSPRR
jgi:hypothetical protein